MADIAKMSKDLTDTKANLAEIRGDIGDVRTLNESQAAKLTAMEATVAQLRADLEAAGGNTAALNNLEAQISDVKSDSRSIADIVTKAPINESGTGEVGTGSSGTVTGTEEGTTTTSGTTP